LKAWRLESREAGMLGGWKAGRPESRKLIIYYSIEASWLPGL
jgi:hypothetical protein